MRAIILAGGRGTRLRPFTSTIPKPLVPVGDVPVMEIVIRQLVAAGFSRITVALNHMAQLIVAFFGNGEKYGITIDYSVESEPLGTIGPLRLIHDLPDAFLVMNADLLTNLDFGVFLRRHCHLGAVGTLAVCERTVSVEFGVVEATMDDRVLSFVEKPKQHLLMSMGISAFSRQILEVVPEHRAYGLDDLLRDCIRLGVDVRVHRFNGYWLDVGRPDDYDRANLEFEKLRGELVPEGLVRRIDTVAGL